MSKNNDTHNLTATMLAHIPECEECTNLFSAAMDAMYRLINKRSVAKMKERIAITKGGEG